MDGTESTLKPLSLMPSNMIFLCLGLKDGIAFELYWAEFNHNDIVRRTVGTKV